MCTLARARRKSRNTREHSRHQVAVYTFTRLKWNNASFVRALKYTRVFIKLEMSCTVCTYSPYLDKWLALETMSQFGEVNETSALLMITLVGVFIQGAGIKHNVETSHASCESASGWFILSLSTEGILLS